MLTQREETRETCSRYTCYWWNLPLHPQKTWQPVCHQRLWEGADPERLPCCSHTGPLWHQQDHWKVLLAIPVQRHSWLHWQVWQVSTLIQTTEDTCNSSSCATPWYQLHTILDGLNWPTEWIQEWQFIHHCAHWLSNEMARGRSHSIKTGIRNRKVHNKWHL